MDLNYLRTYLDDDNDVIQRLVDLQGDSTMFHYFIVFSYRNRNMVWCVGNEVVDFNVNLSTLHDPKDYILCIHILENLILEISDRSFHDSCVITSCTIICNSDNAIKDHTTQAVQDFGTLAAQCFTGTSDCSQQNMSSNRASTDPAKISLDTSSGEEQNNERQQNKKKLVMVSVRL